jgi:hypothetical protein
VGWDNAIPTTKPNHNFFNKKIKENNEEFEHKNRKRREKDIKKN